MEVNDVLISQLARLARLDPTPDEALRLRNDLEKILGMVQKLDELQLDDVEPLHYVNDQANDLRPDRVQPHLDREVAFNNAPDADHERGFFLVPRVIPD